MHKQNKTKNEKKQLTTIFGVFSRVNILIRVLVGMFQFAKDAVNSSYLVQL